MITLDDNRWRSLEGGYRVVFDPRPDLARLEAGENTAAAWQSLWENLHHQGDVGEASYAAVPHLVRIYGLCPSGDWNIYALVGAIELAREEGTNPAVPEWLIDNYLRALQELAKIGAAEVVQSNALATRGILCVIAIAKGLRPYAKLLLDFSEDEIDELIQGI